MNILLIGATGTGKTWVMKELIGLRPTPFTAGLIKGLESSGTLYLGVYDGSTFEGSDKLSMAVAKDFDLLQSLQDSLKFNIVCEGDRFTNSKFIEMFSPIIVKINGDGAEGRRKRGTIQSERHIKSIKTRVDNIKPTYQADNSKQALEIIKKLLDK